MAVAALFTKNSRPPEEPDIATLEARRLALRAVVDGSTDVVEITTASRELALLDEELRVRRLADDRRYLVQQEEAAEEARRQRAAFEAAVRAELIDFIAEIEARIVPRAMKVRGLIQRMEDAGFGRPRNFIEYAQLISLFCPEDIHGSGLAHAVARRLRSYGYEIPPPGGGVST